MLRCFPSRAFRVAIGLISKFKYITLMERHYIKDKSTDDNNGETIYHIVDRGCGGVRSQCGETLFETQYGRFLNVSPEKRGEGVVCGKCESTIDSRAS